MESINTTPTPPKWMIELEEKLNLIKQNRQLGHEFGKGAPCLKCQEKCPGLNLHFWRKKCIACMCKKEDHDVPENDLRYEILLYNNDSKRFKSVREANAKAISPPATYTASLTHYVKDERSGRLLPKQVQFDWVPLCVSRSMMVEYINQLPSNVLPIKGSVGAQRRKTQLEIQIPIHDISPDKRQKLSPKNQKGFDDYLTDVRENVGQGKIVRVLQEKYLEKSQPLQALRKPQHSEKLKQENIKPSNLVDKVKHIGTIKNFANLNIISGDQSLDQNLGVPNKVLQSPNNYYLFQTEEHSPKHQDTPIGAKSLACDEDPRSRLIQTGNIPMMPPDYVPPSSLPTNDGNVFRSLEYNNINDDQKKIMDYYNSNKLQEPEDEVVHAENQEYCVECSGPIEDKSVAIVTFHSGPKVMWHPNCFVCGFCHELLVDLLYFHHKGKVFCGRHFAKLKNMLRCEACDELIFDNKYTSAEDKIFHCHHFCCSDCDMELADQDYMMHNNLPVCILCYDLNYSQNCQTCKKKVLVNERGVKFGSLNWHATPTCFKCIYCNQSLLSGKFMTHDNKPFCSSSCKNQFLKEN